MKQKIQTALQNLKDGDLYDSSVLLLNTLGYASDKDARDIDIPLVHEDIARKVGLFQITDEELEGTKGGRDGDQWVESMLFVAVELRAKDRGYTRSELSRITRELNKAFAIPVIVVFRYGAYATLSIIHRRLNKKDENRDVLEKVTLIKDINLSNPHRAHIEILEAVTNAAKKAKGFVELYNEWQKVLSTQPLNKEFYKRLFEFYEELLASMRYPGDEESKKDFAVRLIGRLIFLKFLIAKGVLSQKIFEVIDGYYHERLEPLFYEQLNTPKDERLECFSDDSVPFLNGGLFEAHKNDYYESGSFHHINTLQIDDSWFVRLFAHFDQYIFTIEENTPNEIEVALDPELLGQVFENLLASLNPETATTARKATGSYYTPREIVDYMVSSSLSEYLKSKSKADKDKIEALCFGKPCDLEFVEKISILQAILELKIIDPACGSGAFPMGLLHRIVAVLDAIDFDGEKWFGLQSDEFRAKHDGRDKNYIRKLSIIQNSIFGVDIQPIACEISKLRFFLSLIIEEDGEPEPLPNLEFKFVCANTLLPLVRKGQQSLVANRYAELENRLKQVKNSYFTANGKSAKEELKKEFYRLQKELKHEIGMDFDNKLDTYDPFDPIAVAQFFDSEWMFGITEGFDIVIGNPPYIRQEKIKELKPILQKSNYSSYNGTADIYIYFFELGHKILKPSGILSFITSNKYTRAKYGREFRKFTLENSQILEYIDFNGVKVFESATVDTSILAFKKTKKTSDFLYCDIGESYKGEELKSYCDKHGFDYSQNDLSSESFTFANPRELKVKKRIEEVGTPLKEWDVKINYGIKTGFNKAFIINSAKREELIAKDPKSAEIIKPILRGRDIKRYGYEWAGLWVIGTFPALNLNIEDYPAVKEYLQSFGARLDQSGESGSRKKTGNKWFETQDQIAYWQEFEKEKIVYQEIASGDKTMFAYDNDSLYTNNKVFIISAGNQTKYLTAILNSKITYWMIKRMCASLGEGFEQRKIFIELLPIPKIPESDQKPFIELVDKILELKKSGDDTTALEAQIDQMVYELYGLSDDEIAIVEGR